MESPDLSPQFGVRSLHLQDLNMFFLLTPYLRGDTHSPRCSNGSSLGCDFRQTLHFSLHQPTCI